MYLLLECNGLSFNDWQQPPSMLFSLGSKAEVCTPTPICRNTTESHDKSGVPSANIVIFFFDWSIVHYYFLYFQNLFWTF